MKSKKYILAIAGVLSLMQCVASYAGTWEQDGQSWKYKKDNGNYAEYEGYRIMETGIIVHAGALWKRIL